MVEMFFYHAKLINCMDNVTDVDLGFNQCKGETIMLSFYALNW